MTATSLAARPAAQPSGGARLATHWFAIFVVGYGLWIWLPWLAPVFMRIGWSGAGRALYLLYSFFCHQLPERSFFLFGPMPMYPLARIQAAWHESINPLVLRQFTGNQSTGWKVAWSDRMVSVYSSLWVFRILWWLLRKKVRTFPWWGFVLCLVPIVLDGSTHALSDLAGIGNGFRDTNVWLSALTDGQLPQWFYAGDALGSFNSWMRLGTGFLAGLGLVWFAMPYVEASFAQS